MVDVASLAVFRALLGATLFVGTLRFVLSGWLEAQYVNPQFFFKYWGASWATVPGQAGLYALFALLAVSALTLALGLFSRVSAAVCLAAFLYVQLLDVTNYLNHYYLVLLFLALLCVLPAGAAYSLDVRLFGKGVVPVMPRAFLWLLRFQIGVVYGFAALAKLQPDWLLRAAPLDLWLIARDEAAGLGWLLGASWAPWFFSWAGFLYDATIVVWLSIKKTRPWAFAAVVVFHTLTHVLFDIGLFPFVMTLATTLFFAPDWPRRFFKHASSTGQALLSQQRLPKWQTALVALYVAVQVIVPLRFLAYQGNVLWHEQGMRFSWRVMVREKSGSVTYQVHSPTLGRTWDVSPMRYLTHRQMQEMSGQPDLILQLAHHIKEDFAGRDITDAEVRVQARVSLNGRAATDLIDPKVDLAQVPDGVAFASWILPAPTDSTMTPFSQKPYPKMVVP